MDKLTYRTPNTLQEWQSLVDSYKNLVHSLSFQLANAQERYNTYQVYLRNQYQDDIARKFLKLWQVKLPQDEELFNCILYISDGEGFNGLLAPKIESRFIDSTGTIRFRYFNKRLDTWITLTP